ncbi:hypothetical protein [Mucilaginibacter sp.]|uniref:hypothetical protein n=1 Tax=Mucilaginibacter sp. TaxID=1882438 RepID=UPI002849A826|nr:hypothetical protein [Mucilaginibacter sp.]MDR3695596.1 hypothetical protein [Mucilaginibacter sp.]
MLKKTLFIAMLAFFCLKAKAQTNAPDIQIVDAYSIDHSTNQVVNVKFKVRKNEYGTFVIATKQLSDSDWFYYSSANTNAVEANFISQLDPRVGTIEQLTGQTFHYIVSITRLGGGTYYF